MQAYHDSRNEECRYPLGAVHTLENVRIRFFTGEKSARVFIRTWNGEQRIYEMESLGNGGFEKSLTMPEMPCLFWYDFIIELDGKSFFYGNSADRLGGEGMLYNEQPPSFQITCYDKAMDRQEALLGKVMYQIFPDRFNRLEMPKSDRTDIYIHENWEDLPLVKQDPRSGDNMALDFFGGSLKGIEKKLSYIKQLGVDIIYLNPIFRARSNHRYDTGNYMEIDPLLGTEEDFRSLSRAAERLGMSIMLDGVFSHTGEDSLYFNRYNNYEGEGAYQGEGSSYFKWYSFRNFPNEYACWWNIPTLPEINKNEPSYCEYIMGKAGVARHWLECGAMGWRLDVADELPMDFLRKLRASIKKQDKNAVLLGEVWEDASNKVSYGEQRSYCLGDSVDSVMNYPLRDAMIAFFLGRINAYSLVRRIKSLEENYPKPFFYSLMNLLGSHDRARILNVLADRDFNSISFAERGKQRLGEREREIAKDRLIKMLKMVVALPGMPTIYYGDEIGMEGAQDPFCRGSFKWNDMDEGLLKGFRQVLKERKERPVLSRGFFEIAALDQDSVLINRFTRDGKDVFGKKMADDSYIVKITRDRFVK